MSFTRTSTCNPSSSGSDTSSTSEEGRLRQLFLSCDSDNDGFLDCNDLVVMCKKLNMTELADDIIHALGAHIKGCITFDEFMRCRRKVLNIGSCDNSDTRGSPCHAELKNPNIPFVERDDKAHDADVESVVDEDDDNIQATRLDSSASDNSLVNSGAEYDSGAQDLSGEPQNLHRLIKKTYPDVYKKYYLPDGQMNNPSLSHLMDCANSLHLSRINSLKTELRDATNRLRNLQTSRDTTLKELNRFQKERAKLRYEQKNQAARYEDRLTELHSVIAELQKKLERTEFNVIREEDEEEDDVLEVVIEGFEENTSTAEKGTTGPGGIGDSMSGSDLKIQLSRVVSGMDQVMGGRKRGSCSSPSKSNNANSNSGTKLEGRRESDTAGTPPGKGDELTDSSRRPSLDQQLPKPGMGSRVVELRAQRQQQQYQQQINDSKEYEWVSEAIDRASKLANTSNRSSIVCVLHAFVQLCPHQLLVDKFREILLEWDRIQACCDRIRSERTVLQVTLEEAKSNAERIQCSLSQYESNYGALQRAHNIADSIVEILDTLVQLYESESKMLLLNCRAAGLPNHPQTHPESIETQFSRARALRRQSEIAAGALLNRLEGGQGQAVSMSALGQHPHGNYMWERGDEHRLRSHLEQLRAERAIMIGSLADPDRSSSSAGRKTESEISLSSSAVSSVEGGGVLSPMIGSGVGGGGGEYDSAASSCSCCPALAAASRGELIEQAVLLQELYATKEERADLRARLYLLEKEMRREELLLKTREAELQAVQVEVDHWRSKASNCSAASGQSSLPGASAGASRIDELCAIVSQLRVSLAMQQEQNQELVSDLKRANSALLQAFDKAKKKYQARIRKLEDELSGNMNVPTSGNSSEKQQRARSETAL